MFGENNSEALRRASLKKQKEAFREKEQLIKNALKSVDGIKNNKIIFDDSITDLEDNYKDNSKKKTLFDDEDDENHSNADEFDFSEIKKPKIVNLGNDPRFAIDERFLNDNEEKEENQKEDEIQNNDNNEDELTNEKNRQLEILENVLGKPVIKKNDNKVPVKRKNKMIRYDPMQDDHQKHEIKKEEPQMPKKKKRKTSESKVEEEKPIPVSNEIFYSVSENLTEALKAPEEFSLLKQFGTAAPEKTKNTYEENHSSVKKSKFGENFGTKNPFKYDSSDDEDEVPVKNIPNNEMNDRKLLSNVEETFFINP